jgi:hypothetical protein
MASRLQAVKDAVRLAALRPGRVLRLPLGLGAGLRLEVVDNGSVHTYAGTAELELAPHVLRAVRPGTVCFDVGGHDAYYALVFARLSGARVVSFEADPQAVARMHRNLARNPGHDVRVVEGFVDAGDHALDVLAPRLGLPLPGLLKVDVDGGEGAVLRGAARILRDVRPHVIVETHSEGLERECGDLLVAAGYRVTVVTQRRWLRQNRPAAHNRWLVGSPVAVGEHDAGQDGGDERQPGELPVPVDR